MADASSCPVVASPVVVQQLYLLIGEFATDVGGRPDGLTSHELRRAWLARHKSHVPQRAIGHLVEMGLIYRTRERRTCTVSGHFRPAYLPYTMRG